MKKVEGLYNENDETFQIFKKEIEEDTRRWKHLLNSWIGRITVMKMAVPLKTSHRFNPTSITIPM
jgi:hypothetical protein